jgi:hypothetical protein
MMMVSSEAEFLEHRQCDRLSVALTGSRGVL